MQNYRKAFLPVINAADLHNAASLTTDLPAGSAPPLYSPGESKPLNPVNAFLDKGDAAYDAGNYAAAVQQYTQAIDLMNQGPAGSVLPAYAGTATGSGVTGGMGVVSDLTPQDDRLDSAHYNRAGAREQTGDIAGAIQDYQYLVDSKDTTKDPQTGKTYAQLAQEHINQLKGEPANSTPASSKASPNTGRGPAPGGL